MFPGKKQKYNQHDLTSKFEEGGEGQIFEFVKKKFSGYLLESTNF